MKKNCWGLKSKIQVEMKKNPLTCDEFKSDLNMTSIQIHDQGGETNI